MKNITRKLITIVLMLGMLLSNSNILVNAKEDNIDLYDTYYTSYDEKGNIVYTNIPIQPKAGTYTKSTLVKSGTVSSENCGYHPDTSVWRKVKSYQFSTSKTVGMSVSAGSYGGTIGVSKTISSGFSFSINANQNKFSKIRVYLSYNWKRYKIQVYDNYSDRLLKTYYSIITNKTHEEFRPVYQ